MQGPVYSFNQSDIKSVLALAEGLGKCPTLGRWFRNLTEKSIELDSCNGEDDMMNISECSIQKVEVEVQTICGTRKSVKFKVFIPQYQPSNNHWEPDDMDIVEVGEFNSLAEAFSHFYVLEAQTFTQDNAMVVLEEAVIEEEEQVWT